MLKYFYIENYGCQMNIYDNELIISILINNNLHYVDNIFKADLIIINTCAIREKAELTIHNRLLYLNSIKKKSKKIIGLIGCLARRINYNYYFKNKILDFILGPDKYRELPNII
ncbi:MAG: tRNA (N6-isopentenyl adenosine(37)-C2)-methylthiotransferase MiaB, partial [Candidatus Shikimatogenerans sp. JK-2022]|nr:tRNA (N6-isopentenyl adenosine(37)-C2)-methylthiotransferase MiaB [Candidatus Shikimatogenerans bostrichidophilus]